MLCYLRALLFKNSWYHYVILQRWGLPRKRFTRDLFARESPATARSVVRG